MKVAIAGGHGQIALALTRLLCARGDAVVGLIRTPGHADDVLAAGAGPGSGAERKWTVDYGGAVKLIEACRHAGVERYVMVGSIGADPDAPGEDVFAVYLRAKGKADADLAASGLAYTIVRPGPLTDDPPTGRVTLGSDLARAPITRGDTAAVVAACLAAPASVGKTFVAVNGDTPVEEALSLLDASGRPGGSSAGG